MVGSKTERSWWLPETKSGMCKFAFQGNCATVIENRQKIRPKRPERDKKTLICWTESRNGGHQSAASGKKKILNYNPYLNMAIYIVTYDLRNESTSDSYTRLVSLIKEEGVWACLGGSSYLVESELTPVALRDKYKQALDHDDKLFVGVVSAPAAWIGYSSLVSDWIKDKM